MRYLLDTHVFLWWNADDARLTRRSRKAISDARAEILLSAASAWEIAIKTRRGRLVLPEPPVEYVTSRMRLHRFQPLRVEVGHALGVYSLPDHHADPFDRLLIAQARYEDVTIISGDPMIARYDVQTLW